MNLPTVPVHVVFVLDTSGSMLGIREEQMLKAIDRILGDLQPDDYFNIVTFSSRSEVMGLTKLKSPSMQTVGFI
jgi:uncharacterized protein YegL